jgi:septum formation protein
VIGSGGLILASGSTARRAMLANAGVPVIGQETPTVDEAALRHRMTTMTTNGATAEQVVLALAEAKAKEIAPRHPGNLVLGGDQILVTAEGNWLEKPADRDTARRHLESLRGTTHRLVSAGVLVRDATVIWHGVDDARLTMRPFSEAFLEAYLEAVGDGVTETVGGYRLEDLGVQLFSRVEGDVFTILGLPLLPLLEELRDQGVIAA